MKPESALHMIRLRVASDRLYDHARRRRLPIRDIDTGYLLHSIIAEVFGDAAPRPFVVTGERNRHLEVLAYSVRDALELQARAETFADPALYTALDWSRFAGKPMPSSWRVGVRYAFEVRACPVVRMGKEGPKHRKGAEVDAYLARSFRVPATEKIDREEVYRDWLGSIFDRHGGARLVSATLKAFKRSRVVRRNHASERRSKVLERPDARLTGELEVTDGAAFAALISRGVGRHRGFGFGMLLLSPAR